MPPPARCPDCATVLPTSGPSSGLCPQCLLTLATNVPFASFHITQLLGEGGTAVVYLAEQAAPCRTVALKLLKPALDAREIVARFASECSVLLRMHHPNIARIFDAGIAPRGAPFFVMEYVDGLPITAFCDQHDLGLLARLGLFLQLTDGVQHAHERGIVHRDLKPSNILVTARRRRPIVKIIDFGLAGLLGKPVIPTHLAPGPLLGTPEYMSPEQAANETVDSRTDIYSLGIILFELLTRVCITQYPRFRLPAPSACAASRGNTILAQQLRGTLDRIVAKAVAIRPEHRHPSVACFAAAIRRIGRTDTRKLKANS